MYKVKMFIPTLNSAPYIKLFKSLANAKAYTKQIVSACESMKLGYEFSIFTKEKTYTEEKREF